MKLVYAIVNSDDTYAVNKGLLKSRHKSHKAFFNDIQFRTGVDNSFYLIQQLPQTQYLLTWRYRPKPPCGQ